MRLGTLTSSYLYGAQAGDDNWVYFSNNDNPGNEKTSFWAQINLTETTATPVRFVYDTTNPTSDITFAAAIEAVNNVPEPSSLFLLALGSGICWQHAGKRNPV
ncbi:MAG: PEP-CTERM sorting domain-containing protein [Akkermansiaceae bacterium]|nr:PEP-CTERM sorting domain-containing protein [Akkermansiaceae bacterium]